MPNDVSQQDRPLTDVGILRAGHDAETHGFDAVCVTDADGIEEGRHRP